MIAARDATWQPPPAAHPIRSRIDLLGRSNGTVNLDLAVAIATAGLLTSGTVLIRGWAAPADYDAAVRTTWADMGAYVVSSADGLTATSRSTSGHLDGGDWDLTAAGPAVAAIVAVACTLADSPSTVRGAGDRAGTLAQALVGLGADVTLRGNALVIGPRRPWPGSWTCDEVLGPAGLTLSAITPITLENWARVEADTPGAARLWTHALAADEYLMPGSAKLPHEYVRSPGDG